MLYKTVPSSRNALLSLFPFPSSAFRTDINPTYRNQLAMCASAESASRSTYPVSFCRTISFLCPVCFPYCEMSIDISTGHEKQLTDFPPSTTNLSSWKN